MVIEAKQVPKGSRFKGYDDYWVQELVIETQTTLYRVEKWRAPSGELVRGNFIPGRREFREAVREGARGTRKRVAAGAQGCAGL